MKIDKKINAQYKFWTNHLRDVIETKWRDYRFTIACENDMSRNPFEPIMIEAGRPSADTELLIKNKQH